jgi:multisubunit Na+/H+ antiporter MnhF subunit
MLQNKLIVSLITIGVVLICELALIGVLAGLGVTIPEQAWSLIYATLGILGGVAGAQYINGKTRK